MLSLLKLRFKFILRDWPMHLALLGVNLLLIAIFVGAFSDETQKIRMGVVDEDQTPYSQALQDQINTENAYKMEAMTLEDGKKALKNREIGALVILPKGMADGMMHQKKYKIQYYTSVNDQKMIIFRHTLEESLSLMENKLKLAKFTQDYLKNQYQKTMPLEELVARYDKNWQYHKGFRVTSSSYREENGSGYDNTTHTVLGMTFFMSMYGIFFTVGDILSDRKRHTFERLMISPVGKAKYILSSMVATSVLGVFNIALALKIGETLFGVDYGSHWGIIMLVVVAFSFAVTAIGLWLSSFLKTPEQLGAVAPVVITSTSMIGGMMWPLEIVTNPALLFLSNLMPQMWAVKGIESVVMYQHSGTTILLPLLVLLGMGMAFLGLGIKGLKA